MLLICIFLPLFNAIIAGFFGRLIGHKGSMFITSFGMFITCFLSWVLFIKINLSGTPSYLTLGKWIYSGFFSVNWGFIFDSLACSMLITVTTVSTLVHFYSCSYMSKDPHISRFMSYLSLFTFFMLILITADNFIQLFVGWEGVGLCSYLLIGFWFTRVQANKSALKAIFINRIGDFGIILGIVLVFSIFQSLDFEIVFSLVPFFEDQSVFFMNFSFNLLELISFFLFIGAVGKSAQIGLHTWLPDAMEGPTPVSALIHAATMVTAGVFLIIRCSPLFEFAPKVLVIITFVGGFTAFIAATIGLVQLDLKKVIAYSTCSQLGYMIFACGISGYTASLFHLINHAFFKALLFLAAGSIIHSLNNEQDMRKMGGLVRVTPFTYSMMLIGSLSLAGFPFLSGFYSKDLILELAFTKYEISSLVAFWLGTISAFFTAFYSFRLLYLTFLEVPKGFKFIFNIAHESSFILGFPLFLLSIGSIFMGFFFEDMFVGIGSNFWLASILVLPKNNFEFDIEFLPFWIKIIPLIFSFLGIFISLMFYYVYYNEFLQVVPKKIYKYLIYFFSNKWYFDYINNFYIALPTLRLSYNFFFKELDKGFFELFGPHGISNLLLIWFKYSLRLHTGYVYHYLSFIGIAFLLVNLIYELIFIFSI